MTNTYNTLNPLGSTSAKDLSDNASNFDEGMNSLSPSFYDRFKRRRETWAGMEKMVADFLEAMGFEATHLTYVDGTPLTVLRSTQLIDRAGSVYKVKQPASFPVNLTGTWATDQLLLIDVGDASLRMALAASTGTDLVGYGTRTLSEKLGEHISVKDSPFNAVGDGVTDDTAAIQAFFDYIDSTRDSGQVISGALSSSYTGTQLTAFFPKGTYRITSTLILGSYLDIVGDSAIIKQDDVDEDIFDVSLYLFNMRGMQFVGGRHHLRFHNDNINSSMIKVAQCQFFLSRSFSVKTAATGGVYTHLSCNATFSDCRWLSNHQVMDNCCDSMVINDAWVQPSVTNMAASTAVFNNKGSSVLDPSASTGLFINRGFMIPDIGTYGVDQPAFIRWVDNYGKFVSRDVRYGGEFGGMPICYHFGAPQSAFPWNKTEVVITGGLVFSGSAADPFACVLGIQGQVPQYVEMGGFSGAVSSPLISNLSSTDLPAYFSSFETASGKKAYEYFKIDLGKIITDIRAYVPLRPMIPDALYTYLVKGRNTRITKTGQTLANGNVSNIISFNTTPEFDNVGAFAAANPTRITMPNGCSALQISVDVVIDASDNLAKAISVQVQNSSGVRWEGISDIYGDDGKSNAFGDGIHFVTTVYGVPGNYWELNIKHSGTTARDLIAARVQITPTNMII